MISKKESNKAIDRAVRRMCVDTIRLWAASPTNKVETCEKILRKQFSFDDKAISELRK